MKNYVILGISLLITSKSFLGLLIGYADSFSVINVVLGFFVIITSIINIWFEDESLND